MSHRIESTRRVFLRKLGKLKDPVLPPFKGMRAADEPVWPSFPGGATHQGTRPGGVSVWYDPSLGVPAEEQAAALLASADGIVAKNNTIFGLAKASPLCNVVLFAVGGMTNGEGGADHMSCDFATGANIEVDVSYDWKQNNPDARVAELFEAEYSECCMGGNLCGNSVGEAASRWCAMTCAGNVLPDFESAGVWQQDGMANWVDKSEGTDGDYDSIGCGMVFMSWLQGPLGISLSKIMLEMVKLKDAGTLAELYANLTSDVAAKAWPKFQLAVTKLGSISSDDPWGVLGGTPVPVPKPPPPPPAPGGPSGNMTLAGVAGQAMHLTLSGPVVSGAVHMDGTLTGGMLGAKTKKVVVSGAFTSS